MLCYNSHIPCPTSYKSTYPSYYLIQYQDINNIFIGVIPQVIIHGIKIICTIQVVYHTQSDILNGGGGLNMPGLGSFTYGMGRQFVNKICTVQHKFLVYQTFI